MNQFAFHRWVDDKLRGIGHKDWEFKHQLGYLRIKNEVFKRVTDITHVQGRRFKSFVQVGYIEPNRQNNQLLDAILYISQREKAIANHKICSEKLCFAVYDKQAEYCPECGVLNDVRI